jgi:hypothetical protein
MFAVPVLLVVLTLDVGCLITAIYLGKKVGSQKSTKKEMTFIDKGGLDTIEVSCGWFSRNWFYFVKILTIVIVIFTNVKVIKINLNRSVIG